MTSAPVVPKIERIGLALVALFLVWNGIAAVIAGRSPRDTIATVLLTTAAYLLGRTGTRFVASWLVPAAILFLAYAVFIESPAGTLSNLSSAGFLGYANAKAAFFVQAAFAAAMIAAGFRLSVVAVVCLPSIALLAMVPIHARSLGGFLSSLLLVPAVFVSIFGKGRRATIALAGIAAFAAITTSVVLAGRFAGYDAIPRRGDGLAERVDPGRASAWADSYRLLREHPLVGVGPGGFGENSPTAGEERDLRWAHNEFLQQGSETGLPGFALLLGLVAWLFWKLWSVGSGRAAVAALAVSALVIHSCAEYLFHFPLLPATAAALAGSAPNVGGPRARRPAPRARPSPTGVRRPTVET